MNKYIYGSFAAISLYILYRFIMKRPEEKELVEESIEAYRNRTKPSLSVEKGLQKVESLVANSTKTYGTSNDKVTPHTPPFEKRYPLTMSSASVVMEN